MGADSICEIDCDFSHDPNDLPRLVDAVAEGADVAIGSRYVPGGSAPHWSVGRRLLSLGGNWYTRKMLGLSVRDATAGFRAYRATSLSSLDPGGCGASGYGFQVEMTYRASRSGMTIVEVPITFRDRTEGTSKMDRSIVIEAMTLVTRWGVQRALGRGTNPLLHGPSRLQSGSPESSLGHRQSLVPLVERLQLTHESVVELILTGPPSPVAARGTGDVHPCF